jgi:hypothetical protein
MADPEIRERKNALNRERRRLKRLALHHAAFEATMTAEHEAEAARRGVDVSVIIEEGLSKSGSPSSS